MAMSVALPSGQNRIMIYGPAGHNFATPSQTAITGRRQRTHGRASYRLVREHDLPITGGCRHSASCPSEGVLHARASSAAGSASQPAEAPSNTKP
jgi:hypothetical protein